jgi:hypothetical protein
MPKTFHQPSDAAVNGSTNIHPVGGQTTALVQIPELDRNDPFHAVYAAAWQGDEAAVVAALPAVSVPACVAPLLLAAVSEWRQHAPRIGQSDPERIRTLSLELEVLRRAKPVDLVGVDHIVRRTLEAEREIAEAKANDAAVADAANYVAALESYFPNLFGKQANRFRLNGGLPPRLMAILHELNVEPTYPNGWQRWQTPEPANKQQRTRSIL